jgi:hypothetical protein
MRSPASQTNTVLCFIHAMAAVTLLWLVWATWTILRTPVPPAARHAPIPGLSAPSPAIAASRPASPAAPAPADDAPEAIQRAYAKMAAALERKDVDGLFALFSADFRLLEPRSHRFEGGRTESYAEVPLATLREQMAQELPDMTAVSLRVRIVRLERENETTATAEAISDMTLTHADTAQNVRTWPLDAPEDGVRSPNQTALQEESPGAR